MGTRAMEIKKGVVGSLNLKTSPAMAAGVTDRLWEVADMVTVLESWEALIDS
jgi:hypothetical protein